MDWNNINTDKDTSGLGPIEYDQSKVPQLIRKHADNVRTKTYGQAVREAQARNAEYAGLIADEARTTADTAHALSTDTQSRFNDQISGNTDINEVIDARRPTGAENAYATLNERLEADGTSLENFAKNEVSNINVNASWYGCKSDYVVGQSGSTDNAPFFQAAYDAALTGSEIKIPAGNYRTTQPLPSGDKKITWIGAGSNLWTDGTSIYFDDTSAFIPQNSYDRIKKIAMYGKKKNNISLTDINNPTLGNVALDLRLSDVINTGGFSTDDVRIEGFDVAIAERKYADGTWGGAYRQYNETMLRYNGINFLALNQVTHSKFFGGLIAAADMYGIYVKSNIGYTNLNFFGTIIESNGTLTSGITKDKFTDNILDQKMGIYVQNATVNLIGCYLENEIVFADNVGRVKMTNTHVNDEVLLWAWERGSIDVGNSLGTNEYTFGTDYIADYRNHWTAEKLLIRDIGSDMAGAQLYSSDKNLKVSLWTDYERIRQNKANNISWGKVTLHFKLLTGQQAPSFAVKPFLEIKASGSTATINLDNILPPRFLKQIYNGSEYYYEFYFKIPFGTGKLLADNQLWSIKRGLNFQEDPALVDYSTTGLTINLLQFDVTIFGDKRLKVIDTPNV